MLCFLQYKQNFNLKKLAEQGTCSRTQYSLLCQGDFSVRQMMLLFCHKDCFSLGWLQCKNFLVNVKPKGWTILLKTKTCHRYQTEPTFEGLFIDIHSSFIGYNHLVELSWEKIPKTDITNSDVQFSQFVEHFSSLKRQKTSWIGTQEPYSENNSCTLFNMTLRPSLNDWVWLYCDDI